MTDYIMPSAERLSEHIQELEKRIAALEFGIEECIEFYAEDLIDTTPLRLVLQGRALDAYNQAHQS